MNPIARSYPNPPKVVFPNDLCCLTIWKDAEVHDGYR